MREEDERSRITNLPIAQEQEKKLLVKTWGTSTISMN
jgi:hypothetical protein